MSETPRCHRCRAAFQAGEEIVLLGGHWQHALARTCKETQRGVPECPVCSAAGRACDCLEVMGRNP